MNRRLASCTIATLAPLLIAADKPVLVPDVSARQVQIRYSFAGGQLLLFGAIAYPNGRTPTRPADIAVVLRGPVQPILLREKQKIAGIWMNADSAHSARRRSFYAVSSSQPIRDLVDERTASIYELGIHNLQLSPGGGALPEKERHFEAGLLDLRSRAGTLCREPARRRDQRRHPLSRCHQHPEPGPGRHLHGRNLSHRPRPGRCRRYARHRDQQVRVRALRLSGVAARSVRLRARLRRLVAGPRVGGRAGVPPPLLKALPKAILTACGVSVPGNLLGSVNDHG